MGYYILLGKNLNFYNNFFGLFSLFILLNNLYIFTTFVDARSNVHIVYLGDKPHDDVKMITNSHHDMLATVLGSKEAASDSMLYSYKHGFSGFAAKLTQSQAQEIAKLPGVVRVIQNQLLKLHTTRSWDYLGLSSSDSSSTPTNYNLLHDTNMGDGVIIGVLDTGIWPESKSFNDEGLGPIPSRWKGICQSGEQFNSTHCNRKLIGARWFIKGFLADYGQPFNTTENPDYLSPRDPIGHGTHTSSIAAGSFVANASFKGLGLGTLRGGAPRARLVMYKVCWNILGGQCASADVLKAFDQAIHDGVDVLSVSIGFGIPHFADVDDRDGIAVGSFHAVAKGITVVCAGGNDGPFDQTIDNPSPWVLTVAASTIDRAFPTPITLGNGRVILGQAMFIGKEVGFTGLVHPEGGGLEPTTAGVCESLSLNGTSVAGNVVFCFTSSFRRNATTRAASLVKAAGGVGVLVAKNPSNLFAACSNDFPCIEVDYALGTQILYYIRSQRSPMVKLSPSKTLVGKPVSTKVAYFSSRGPSSIAPAILKPDIAAPGVSILAASSPFDPLLDGGFAFHSGTSMATPIVTGIVALLKSAHPDWSPAAIKSALVTTAWITDPSGEPIFANGAPQKLANPFDFGGGLVNPNRAADPGLIYDMGAPDYIHYLCSMGYNDSSISQLTQNQTVCPSKRPSILDVNLPSITVPSLRNSTTITRTVTNVGPVNSVYRARIFRPFGVNITVDPKVLVFSSTTKSISFKVTVTSRHQVNTGYYFGSLIWNDGVHSVRSPISVKPEIIESYVDDA